MKLYRSRRALHCISFEVQPVEIVALLRPNGAGKSTTLSLRATLLEPTSGHVYLAGHSYRDTAVALGIPEGTAKSRGRLALGKLATALEARGITR